MNGKTTIDATLNPCSAWMDRHTYGWRLLNVSTWGKRWLRVGLLGVYMDLYWSGCWRPLYARMHNGAVLFFPGGSVTWPMPTRRDAGGKAGKG
jgi:hypothetical protein